MKHLIIPVLISLFFIHCNVDREIPLLSGTELHLLGQFESIKSAHQLQISPENEPGEKLKLCLTFISKESKAPMTGKPVKFYHTSEKGEYEPTNPADESTARLNGEAYTDEKGRIFVQTILPGDYGTSEDNRHIHTTVNGARPQAYDIHFDQYTTPMGRRFAEGSDQHFLADLRYSFDSTLVCFVTIEVKNIQQ